MLVSQDKGHSNLLLSLKSPQPTLNLTHTRYPIIKEIALKMHMQVDSQYYSLLWTDHPLSLKQIKEQLPAKVNHLPEITQITRKNKLAAHLNIMRLHFPKEYNFYPETYIMPLDYHRLKKKHVRGKVYIVKPENGSQGHGIYLTSNISGLEKQRGQVIQEYVTNPMLIKGLKFDLRIYVLITSVRPLRIYLYNEGIARFATELFHKPSESNLNNAFSHLTNYAINKQHSSFSFDQQQGHKRLLTSIFQNQHYASLMQQISEIVIKTVIAGLPPLQAAYQRCKSNDPGNCFQLLGFDVMLTDKQEALLIEVNQNPSLNTDNPFDHNVKSELVRNILDIVTGGYRCSPEDKYQSRVKLKDRHQHATKGQFTRIYPCQTLEQTEHYDRFMSKASTIYNDRYGLNMFKSQSNKKSSREVREVSVSWNQQPSHYNQRKMQKIYGIGRSVRTSSFKKRLIFS